MKKRIRTNGAVIAAAVVAIALRPQWFLQQPGASLPVGVQGAGLCLLLFGLLVRVVSRGYKAEHSANSTQLVDDGPYALVRNPMYLGITCIGSGVILFIFQLWTGGVFALFMLVRYATLVRDEERQLGVAFGDQYRRYLRRVCRIVPRLPLPAGTSISTVLPLRVAWVRRELNNIVLVPLGCLVVRLWITLRAGAGAHTLAQQAAVFVSIIMLYVIGGAWLAHSYETSTNTR